MRRLWAALALAGTILHAQSLPELVADCKNAPLLKAAHAATEVAQAQSDTAKSALYPSLDASLTGTYLKDKPVVYMQSSFSALPPGTTMQIQSQQVYLGALRLTYPLFTGFAVSAGIDAAKIEAMKAQLSEEDTRRNLYLHLVQAYAQAVMAKSIIQADTEAAKAMNDSYAKAKGFYDKGLLAESDLLRIKADRLSIDAALIRDKNLYRSSLLRLSYLSDTNVTAVSPLPQPQQTAPGDALKEALNERPDLKALRAQLHLAKTRETAADSGYYPKVSVYGQLASQGDTLALDGDGYTNKDKSAAGFEVTYNLFSGFKTSSEHQAAQAAQLSARWAIAAYEKQIETEIRSTLLNLHSLRSESEAAKMQLDAEAAYCAKVEGQFAQQLADADLLSRAIAARARARSQLAVSEAKLYAAYATLLLQISPGAFESALKE
jgi:outer membrane protein